MRGNSKNIILVTKENQESVPEHENKEKGVEQKIEVVTNPFF